MRKIYILCALPLLLGCNKAKTTNDSKANSSEIIYDYSDVSHLTIEWKEILNQEEERYFGYVYSSQCGHCKEIKQDVIKAALNGEKKIYFITYTKEIPIITNAINNIGVDDYEKLGIIGTPSLFEIENRIVMDCYTGSKAIIATLTNQ